VNFSDLLGAPERRILTTPLEVRAANDNQVVLDGYASVFNAPYDIWGGPSRGGFTEVVDPKAFNRTLAAAPDLHLLINHEGLPLARTKSGTLHLSVDDHGLKVRAELDPSDPDVQRLMPKMARGDMDEMSFAFRTVREAWSNEDTERRLLEVNIDKGDVSVVNFGANPATSTTLAGAIRALASVEMNPELNPDLLAEMRAESAQIEAARLALAALARGVTPPAKRTLSVAEARAISGH
jgi:HK97 family phage prohead protease